MNILKYARYYSTIRYLESLNNISGSYQKINLTAHPHPEMYLQRMQDLLDRIDNPEKGFKYIHITGTAGKGSVSSIVHATLLSHSKSVGLFASPFTVSTIEKIQVGKSYIDPLIFSDMVESIKPHIDSMSIFGKYGMPSYFEIIFAIALLYFQKMKCEYVVLEVGLGGRYDATNIIKNPLVTAITNIGLDHIQVLGSTEEKIAHDKAGIIKKDSIFFTTEDDRKLLSIFKNECGVVGASYHECKVRGLDYEKRNELLAGSICLNLGIIEKIEAISIPEQLPARFEIVGNKPLVIIDGAHNVAKIKATAHKLKRYKYKELSLVIAISADKDWKSMLKILLPVAKNIYVTRFITSNRQCVSPKDLMEFAKNNASKSSFVSLYSDPIKAFNEAKSKISQTDALLVTGSFYLAGDIRSLYCPEEQILKQRNSRLKSIKKGRE